LFAALLSERIRVRVPENQTWFLPPLCFEIFKPALCCLTKYGALKKSSASGRKKASNQPIFLPNVEKVAER
jgi:hypothetical protein